MEFTSFQELAATTVLVVNVDRYRDLVVHKVLFLP
jgi:hypothetical protein